MSKMDPLAAQCLLNQGIGYDQFPQPVPKRGRPPGPHGGERRTPQAKAVGRRKFTNAQTPWNRPCAMKLILCDAARKILPTWSEHK